MTWFTTAALIGLIVPIVMIPFVVRSLPAQRAVLLVLLASMLFGPEVASLKFPNFPPLDKNSLPLLVLLPAVLLLYGRQVRDSRIWTPIDWVIVVGFLGALATALTNGDGLVYGEWIQNFIPAMTLKDGLSNALHFLYNVGFAFLIGRWLFREPRHMDLLLRFLVLAGLTQVPFILFEVRMSPMLHSGLYGYAAQMDFTQVLRYGGYRPTNFMAHGLALAIFMFAATYCSYVVHRTDRLPVGPLPSGLIFVGLLVTLVLVKSTGAVLWAFMFLPVLWRCRSETIVRLAAAIALVAATYPVLRALGLFPVERILELAGAVSDERAASLRFRFVNEEVLLDKARERGFFGWGTYGRAFIYDEEIGTKQLSVTDGYWIIALGEGGALKFFNAFGLLVLPVFLAFRRLKLIADAGNRYKLAALALLVAIMTAELIPNGLFNNFVYVVAGALAGFTQEIGRPGSAWRPTERTRTRPAEASSPSMIWLS